MPRLEFVEEFPCGLGSSAFSIVQSLANSFFGILSSPCVEKFGAVHDMHPCFSELGFDRSNRAAEIDGAAGVAQDKRLQAETTRIESRIAHAIVVGEPGKKDPLQPAFAEIAGQACRRPAVILKKSRVGINVRAKAFAEDQLGLREMQRGVKLRSFCAPNAVRRPERLCAVGKLDGLEGLFAGMRCRERGMIGRVPVLSENDVLEARRGAMDGLDDFVSAGNGERSAGTKIILHVDDEENVVRIDLHPWLLRGKSERARQYRLCQKNFNSMVAEQSQEF